MDQKLLFITHKIHELDDDFAFTTLWAQEFQRQGFDVIVLCLEKGVHTSPLFVLSLGKEEGLSHMRSLMRFYKYLFTIPHDRVFVHMNPKWIVAGSWFWFIFQTPTYLWYTHYTIHFPLRIAHFLCKRLFAATKESMPQYDNDPKKIVTGHGIDMRFWEMNTPARSEREPQHHLLSVHRICRSKRIHLTIEALALLPEQYTLTHYGPVFEKDYQQELNELVLKLQLSHRVTFMGSVPMPELRNIYPRFNVMINMAYATIDKTMVEGMCAGVHPIVSSNNATAIGLTTSPYDDTPKSIAEYIQKLELVSIETLQTIARHKHSLTSLITNMSNYIRVGN